MLTWTETLSGVMLLTVMHCAAEGGENTQCDYTSLKENAADELLSELKGKVHGQQVAVDTIASNIRGHLVNRSPPKALVLSLHGPTGVGKTFVSEIIARSIYVNGTKSAFVQKVSLARDYPDVSKSGNYKTDLRDRIVSTLKRCARSLFIIEEFDTNSEIANELSTVIKLFVEYGDEPFDGVTTKKAIFIFISNQGSVEITKSAEQFIEPDRFVHLPYKLFKRLWYGNINKEETMDREIRTMIEETAKTRLGYRLLAETNLITQFVYFLPLRREHVELCVRDVLYRGNLPRFMLAKKYMDDVFSELEWTPKGNPVFSVSGCKRVEEIVNRMLGTHREERPLKIEL